ncbi:MAG: tetratricopeptide repeat protein [Magnetococcales bacterium]|nr:tetratricopeptide repeat protein [Magnetococcales bacterium]
MAQGMVDAAIASIRHALMLKPDHAQSHNNLGNALLKKGELAQAATSYRQAIKLKPDYTKAHYNLGNALQDQGLAGEAVASYRQALALQPDFTDAHSNLLHVLHYDTTDPEPLFQEHRQWQRQQIGPDILPMSHHPNDPHPDKLLRVGLVSGDLRGHSVSYFLAAPLAALDGEQVQIHAYATAPGEDATTQHLKSMTSSWQNIAALSDHQARELIQRDGIDILVDLSGHTGTPRLKLFAAKPAPVQVNWLGYPDTTGLDAMDYRFTDAIADPPGVSDQWASEKLIRLPNGFHCYHSPREAPDITPPLQRSWPHHLSQFQQPGQNHPPGDPNLEHHSQSGSHCPADLILKNSATTCPEVRSRYQKLFEEGGVAWERIQLISWAESTFPHLSQYGEGDIALAPFPYNGVTTTCEAMWMGLPVVTLLGECHAGRVAGSLIGRVGLPSLVATSIEGNIDIAVELANNPTQLEEMRSGLREKMWNSPLCDGQGFSRDLEQTFRSLWQEWCNKSQETDNTQYITGTS